MSYPYEYVSCRDSPWDSLALPIIQNSIPIDFLMINSLCLSYVHILSYRYRYRLLTWIFIFISDILSFQRSAALTITILIASAGFSSYIRIITANLYAVDEILVYSRFTSHSCTRGLNESRVADIIVVADNQFISWGDLESHTKVVLGTQFCLL